MARLSPKFEVLRALFTRSGNQCAFLGCVQPLLNEKNQFVGQMCHIEAAMPRGERYNTQQTDEERRSYDNLVLFCYQHHIETNDVEQYSVSELQGIKIEHEKKFEKNDFKIDESALFKIISEMEEFWSRIERLNTLEPRRLGRAKRNPTILIETNLPSVLTKPEILENGKIP